MIPRVDRSGVSADMDCEIETVLEEEGVERAGCQVSDAVDGEALQRVMASGSDVVVAFSVHNIWGPMSQALVTTAE